MPVKHFIVSPDIKSLSKGTIQQIESEKISTSETFWKQREDEARSAFLKDCKLKHVDGRVLVKMDIESKNYYTFANGTRIRRERKFNNFNFREVNPSNGFVVSADNIPVGAEVLIDYTAVHDSYKIFDYDSGSSDIEFYSVRECDCYAWRIEGGQWEPAKNCEFALRVYKPYEGRISFITPELIKDSLFITTGKYSGYICQMLKGSDYQIVFTDENGKEGNLIRVRHSDLEEMEFDEIVAINQDLTDLYNDDKLLVGLTPDDGKFKNKIREI